MSSSADHSVSRFTWRIFDASGKKLSTAVSYKNTIFQVAPEKKSFPTLEAWKAEHPSHTNFTEQQDASQPSDWRPFRKAPTPSLRHLAEYTFQFPGKNLFFFHPTEQKLVMVFYTQWARAFMYIRKEDNCLDIVYFTSFTELGCASETPDLWVSDEFLGITLVKLPKYIPSEGQKEAFVLVNGRHTSVLAAQALRKKLEEKGVIVHCGFYEKHTRFYKQIWIGSPNVFKVEQTPVYVSIGKGWEYAPLFTHMRQKPWKKDLLLNVHPSPEDYLQKGIDAALEIVCEN